MKIINTEVKFLREHEGRTIQRGYEQQRYVFHRDGSVSVNAFSIAFDHKVSREVTCNMSSDWRPHDSYVRIQHDEHTEGSGWFTFRENGIQADIWNRVKGRYADALEIPGGVRSFSGHPIAFDAVLMAAFDKKSSIRKQHIGQGIVLSSAHHFGAEGPEIAPVQLEIEYVGDEKLTTDHGTFEADHWRILPGNEITGHTHPGEEIWTLKDTFVFLRATLPAADFRYELSDFSERNI